MPHERKLSVYTINLNPSENTQYNHNKWLFRNLIGQANTTPLTDSFIMGEIFRLFISSLDKPEMYAEPHSKKCMTANQMGIEDDNTNPNIGLHSEQFIIEGRVEGGSYGRKRNKTSTVDKTNKTEVSDRDAITVDFYFLIYTPLRSSKSILMIQSYSDDTIDSVMKKFWANFFTYSQVFKKPIINKFFPTSIIEDFKRYSVVSALTFSTEVPGETLLDNVIIHQDRKYKVQVQIKPLGENLSIQEFENSLPHIQRSFFTSFLRLGQFFKKTGTLKDVTTNKSSPFEIGDFDIHPSIVLSKYIDFDDNESDFIKIRDYCFSLLENIKLEIYAQNAVLER